MRKVPKASDVFEKRKEFEHKEAGRMHVLFLDDFEPYEGVRALSCSKAIHDIFVEKYGNDWEEAGWDIVRSDFLGQTSLIAREEDEE